MSGLNDSPHVLFDTTVLWGAILGPVINRQLLTLAAQTVDYRVVLSRVRTAPELSFSEMLA